ncbi:MAG: peptidyl-prolyl cis-trans isomerase [Clostridia bacterium]|nr:peptidyl-prolyl cis-trans isomerase [Clostridia bacterium]
MKRFLTIILAALMVVSLVACVKKDTDTTDATGATSGSAAVSPDAAAVILQSEHYTITVAEFQYFLAKTYDDFASQYGDMINYMLDTTKPLRDQKCPVDQTGKMTWFDYVADGAVTTVKSYLLIAEQALKEGYEISEEDKALIKAELDSMDEKAAEAEYANVEDYIRDYYGSFATKETLQTCFNLSFIANSYRAEKYNSYDFTEEDYSDYAEKNPASCYKADFMYLRMSANIKEGATDAEKAAEWEKTKQAALDFNNAIKGKDSFISLAEDYMRSYCTIVEDETKVDYDKNIVTEEILKESAKGAETVGVAYSTGAKNVDWIFAKGRLSGEQTVIEDEENYTCEIIYMLKPMYLDESPTVDVRHILITPKTEGDDYKASTKANEIYKTWSEGEATEESFAELAAEFTEDTGSRNSGGLYDGVVPGQMVTEFNDWCFDPARKAGDTDIVKTDYGYHIMYFVEAGMPKWQATADTGLRDTAVNGYMEDLGKEHQLTYTADNLAKCPDLFGN